MGPRVMPADRARFSRVHVRTRAFDARPPPRADIPRETCPSGKKSRAIRRRSSSCLRAPAAPGTSALPLKYSDGIESSFLASQTHANSGFDSDERDVYARFYTLEDSRWRFLRCLDARFVEGSFFLSRGD